MAGETRKNGETTGGRNPDGTFAAGNPGRPKGSRHKTTEAAMALLDGQVEALTQAAIDKALEGDTAAIRLCLERIAPARKDAPIAFDLPEMKSAHDASEAAQAVLRAVSESEITPGEGAQVMALVETHRKTLETVELEQRISQLEEMKR